MASDGNFQWYWGAGAEPDGFVGPFDNGDAAQLAARAKQPDGDYVVAEADKLIPDHRIFDANQLMSQYWDKNANCWGKDGHGIILTDGEKEELVNKLGDCFERFLRKHALDRGIVFGTIRVCDYFPGRAPAADLEGAN